MDGASDLEKTIYAVLAAATAVGVVAGQVVSRLIDWMLRRDHFSASEPEPTPAFQEKIAKTVADAISHEHHVLQREHHSLQEQITKSQEIQADTVREMKVLSSINEKQNTVLDHLAQGQAVLLDRTKGRDQ